MGVPIARGSLASHCWPADPGWEREIKPKAIEPLQKFLNEGMQVSFCLDAAERDGSGDGTWPP